MDKHINITPDWFQIFWKLYNGPYFMILRVSKYAFNFTFSEVRISLRKIVRINLGFDEEAKNGFHSWTMLQINSIIK